MKRSARRQVKQWMHEVIEHGLKSGFAAIAKCAAALPKFEEDVLEGRISSFRAARTITDHYYRENNMINSFSTSDR